MTGTAVIVAQEVELSFGDEQTSVSVIMMDQDSAELLTPARGAAETIFLICTSTYGQGDIPDNARDLFESLEAHRPELSHIRYGVLGLGDRTYQDTFNFGGKKFDELFNSLGARRIGERAQIDASADGLPEDAAIAWAAQWLQTARAHLASAYPSTG